MKKIKIFLMVLIIFVNVMHYDTVDVKATSVAVATGAYVTGEAIWSIMCTCFVLCGFAMAVDDTIDYINMTDEEYELYIEELISSYEKLCNELLSSDTINESEMSMAWLILAEANTGTLEGDCQVLADAINEARDKGLDLRGIPLDSTALKSSQMVWYDDTSSSVIASPTFINDMCGDIVNAINSYPVVSCYDGLRYCYGDADYAIGLFDILPTSLRPSANAKTWVITYSNYGSSCYAYYPNVVCDYYTNFSGSTYASLNALGDSKKIQSYKIFPDTSIDEYKANAYNYDLLLLENNIVAWGGDTHVGSDYVSDATAPVATTNDIIDVSGVDNLTNVYDDTDTLPVVDEMVVVPPVDTTLEHVSDVIWGQAEEAILDDATTKEAIKTAVVDISEEQEKVVADELVDELVQDSNPSLAVGLTPSGLSNKFPFCIPFDLIDAISMLGAKAEAPKIVIPIVNERLGIDEEIVIDFAQFESVAVVCRTTFSIGFLISLIVLTRKIVKG